MKKKLNLSYNKKRLQKLPQIQGSNINLSINNTYVVIKNQTPDNYSFIQKDILPNIFTYNEKKKEKILAPIKKIKKQLTPNISTFDFMHTNKTNTLIKEEIKEEISSDDFILTTKLLNRLLWFFNIRELLILMNINKKINTFIKNTVVFQKYKNIRNDYKNGTLFSNLNINHIYNKSIINLKNSILKKPNNNIKIQINTESNNYFINNNNDNDEKNINSFIKFSMLNKKKVKLKKILNPEIYQLNQITYSNESNNDIPEIKKYKKENSNIKIKPSNINIFSNNNIIDSLNNSLFSSRTGSSKNEIQSKIDDKNNEFLELEKLKSNFLSLIKNNGYKMKLFMKKYKLNYTETKIIMNGIIELFILKKQKYENEKNNNNNFFSSLTMKNIKADKFMIFYFDPILNLDLEDITRISFENIIISSMNIMRKICHLLWRNFTTIKILSLQNNNINDNCAQILFHNLKFNKAINILNLSYNKISNTSIEYSDLFFKNNHSLNTLVLSNNYLGSNGCINLMNFLKCNQKSVLRTLDIGYNGISEEGMSSLFIYIKTNNKLLSLFFPGNCLGNTGLEQFVKSLFNQDNNNKNVVNSKISYLDLSNNKLTKESCKYINSIISMSEFITSINIGYNSLYNEGVNNIFECLNKKSIKSKLISLDLSQTNINEKCIEFITSKIDKTTPLRILNLSYNNLSKSCIYLKQLLIKETNIKVLKLISCKISDNINLIFHGLCNNNNIETFDLSDNIIIMNQKILSDILCFFKENKKILNLILDSTNIDDVGLNYISQGIEHNTTIKKLSLKNNLITNENLEILINSIQKNEIIRKIELEGNGISQKCKEKIYLVLENKLNKSKKLKLK